MGANPNTIALSSTGDHLFVSVRGRNNPTTYLKRGPEFGKLLVIDAPQLKVVDWAWCRNQPTGLAVSPDARLVAITDFLDDNIEVYDVSGWTRPSPAGGIPGP